MEVRSEGKKVWRRWVRKMGITEGRDYETARGWFQEIYEAGAKREAPPSHAGSPLDGDERLAYDAGAKDYPQ